MSGAKNIDQAGGPETYFSFVWPYLTVCQEVINNYVATYKVKRHYVLYKLLIKCTQAYVSMRGIISWHGMAA